MEQWKPIEGYEGLYEISNLGNVRALEKSWVTGKGTVRHQKEKILKLAKDTNGYLQLNLYKDGKYKYFRVHRLVALHFLPNPNNYNEVNHKDEVKTNNIVSNLEWCSRQYNAEYSLSKPILQINKEANEVIREWPSIIQVERELGINQSSISRCCKGKKYYKSAGGFKWKYKKA